MPRKFHLVLTRDPLRDPLRAGFCRALQEILKLRLGPELTKYTHAVTESVGIIEIPDSVELGRITEPAQYQSIYPGIIRVELREILDEAVTETRRPDSNLRSTPENSPVETGVSTKDGGPPQPADDSMGDLDRRDSGSTGGSENPA